MEYEIRCRKCGRYLGSGSGSLLVKLKCANCKSLETYQIVALSHYLPSSTTLVSVQKPS